jgi:DNA-binding NarL/FixJ family response regulator
VLEERGFVICAECADTRSAVVAAERERPDVCLLDIRMPGNGIAAASQIASRVPRTAVIMLTVSADDEDLFAALVAGAAGYLLKDAHPDRLAAALREVLGGAAALSPALVARVIEEFRDPARRRAIPRALRRAAVLTAREWEVLELLRQGLPTATIAERLAISPVTVRRHVSRAIEALRVRDREAAVRVLDEHPSPERARPRDR